MESPACAGTSEIKIKINHSPSTLGAGFMLRIKMKGSFVNASRERERELGFFMGP